VESFSGFELESVANSRSLVAICEADSFLKFGCYHLSVTIPTHIIDFTLWEISLDSN
jgi:hypothetical protein